jgi:hypothetical protein
MAHRTLDYCEPAAPRSAARCAVIAPWVVFAATLAMVSAFVIVYGWSINRLLSWAWLDRFSPELQYSQLFLWSSGAGVLVGVVGAILARSWLGRLTAVAGMLANLILGTLLWLQSAL